MALKVVRNELDGWDVVRDDEGVALSNHPDRETAEAAARLRAHEERVSAEGDEPVEIHPEEVHAIDDARQGMRPAFLALGALLLAITILVVIISLTGSLTGFGS
jgi:hypothetical protein